MMSLPKLVWSDWNREHINKHAVTEEEAEYAYSHHFLSVDSYKGRKLYYGKLKNGRAIGVAVSFEKQEEPYVVSARDMSKKERRLYL